MATPQRQTESALIERLIATQRAEDDFFQLVRLLERHLRRRQPDGGARVGGDTAPAAEPLRFHASRQPGFPARAVERLWPDPRNGDRQHLAVTFMGLTGPSGALPGHYSRLLQERLKQRDQALAAFLDLFNHRLLSLYYRAWAKYRPTVQREDHALGGQRDPLTRALQALAGQPCRGNELPLYYGGHFARASRSAVGLEQLLADFLGERVRVESFVGQWLPIQPCDRAVIGRRGRNHRLGDGVLLGARVWDVQSKFRIVIGPLPAARYRALLPDGERFARLRQLIRGYAPSHLDVELRFLIEPPAAAAKPAGRSPSPASDRRQAPRLGWDLWLQGRGDGPRTATLQLR